MIRLGPIANDVDRKFRLPRMWSNRELIQFGHLFHGDVVNVSAGEDVDKEGHTYREYFANCRSYSITNYGEGLHRGFQGREGEISLDLCKPLRDDYVGEFDIVFNHTTLEHVINVQQAMENICRLSRDIVILVVPFLQVQHETSGYKDYWRFTPTLLQHLFQQHGFSVLYETANTDRGASVYIFQIATRHPQHWKDIPRKSLNEPLGDWLGHPMKKKTRLFERLSSPWTRLRKSA